MEIALPVSPKIEAPSQQKAEAKPVERIKREVQKLTKEGKEWFARKWGKVEGQPKEVIKEVAEAPKHKEELLVYDDLIHNKSTSLPVEKLQPTVVQESDAQVIPPNIGSDKIDSGKKVDPKEESVARYREQLLNSIHEVRKSHPEKSSQPDDESQTMDFYYQAVSALVDGITDGNRCEINGDVTYLFQDEQSYQSDVSIKRDRLNRISIMGSSNHVVVPILQELALESSNAYVEQTQYGAEDTTQTFVVFGVDTEELKPQIERKVREDGKIFVGQSTYGIFDPRIGSRIVGTDGMGPCTAVILENTNTGVFAFSHIDEDINGHLLVSDVIGKIAPDVNDHIIVRCQEPRSELGMRMVDQIGGRASFQMLQDSPYLTWDGNNKKTMPIILHQNKPEYDDNYRLATYEMSKGIQKPICVFNELDKSRET